MHWTKIVLKYVSMNSQEWPEIINVNSNRPAFYPHSIQINKRSGGCNSINYSYAKLCVPDVVKNIKYKLFNLMLRTNQIWHIK